MGRKRPRKILPISACMGKGLRKTRKFLGWTQEKLAGEIFVEPSTISRLERSKNKPKYFTIMKMLYTFRQNGIIIKYSEGAENVAEEEGEYE